MDFYVYLHKKKTTGEVFYVGKGCGPRAWTKARRSSEWNEVVEKYGYFVEIVENNLQEWYSFELEGLLIDYYGKLSDKDGSLVNKKGGSSCNFDSTIKKADRDYSTYTFYNFSTEEKFIGNRYDFKKKYKDVEAHILFYGNRSSKGWIVLDSKSDFEVLCFKNKFKGEYSSLSSDKEFHLYNLYTNCEFIGTRHAFQEKFGFKPNHILRPGKVVQHQEGWCLYSERNSVKRLKQYHFISEFGEEFVGTRTEFKHKYGINPAALFGKRSARYVSGWALFQFKDIAFVDGYDRNIYKFVHKNGDVFEGTRGAFEKRFGINIRPLFGKGKSKTQKGWRLEEFSCKNEESVL